MRTQMDEPFRGFGNCHCGSNATCTKPNAATQENNAKNAGAQRAAEDAAASTQEIDKTNRPAETKAGIYVRASKMIGTNVQNPEGKNVGQINDFVIDADTGRIRYAAVTYGGFLGMEIRCLLCHLKRSSSVPLAMIQTSEY